MNKTLYKTLSVLFLAATALTSCEKCGNVAITEPTPEDSQWLVYQQKDTIPFQTETADVVRYTRTGIYAQNVPGEGLSLEDECIDQVDVQVRTVLEDIADAQPYLSTRILSKPNDLVVELAVGENAADKAVELGVWEIDERSPSYDSLEVNDRMYYEVFEVNPESTAANNVSQLLYNKEFGFLRVAFNSGKKLERIAAP
ncbi:hypothetical protein [Pontibacter russatus]|uniref:hypothetical protein n=1 Tax=Pontibacter russatus TaxID=2694929 RepID=UPI00137A1BD8|nr:hypothetical protein [Pontibacter russatus]